MILASPEHSLTSSALETDCDLVIVGGNIVGATLASALKHSGLRIVLVETQPLEVAAAKRQAYAFSLLSSRILSGIGVWDDIFPHVGKFRQIRLSDADYPQVVEFETKDLQTEFLGYVAQHGVVLTALQEFIADCPNIDWLCPAEVTAVEEEDEAFLIRVKVEEQERQIRTKLVVGADGARSRIRQQVGIKTHGWKYWQSCIAFTIEHEAPRNDIAFERFWYTGPMGILPLPENRCQIVWTAPHALAKSLYELDEQDFLAKLQERLGGVLGSVKMAGDRFLFPVQLMQSDRYVRSRLALIGDAAHCCHPVGGQGLNLGIQDAAALAEVLQKANQEGKDIGDIRTLKAYERWRKLENWTILGFTDFLNRSFSNRWLPMVIARRLGLWMLCYLYPFKTYALQLMTGLRGRLPQLARR